MAVPLDLSINPMSVLQDPFIGRRCRAMFEDGDVDDRFLMILYLDVLPTTFGNPLWFTEDELAELKGTTLHRASVLQVVLLGIDVLVEKTEAVGPPPADSLRPLPRCDIERFPLVRLQRKNLQALYDDKVKVLVDELLPGDVRSDA
ncbi:hypothetical protein KSP40_PGU016150 [Platanthera guangdongensis]|uniref:Uncharacterized protein n=1 Tax=Platanthera guangdongensis TaxID=2320717 RepID=A0ABR2N036_9ASPA